VNWLGDYPEDFTTVAVYFTTHDPNGAPVAPLTAFEADDVKIYKNGSGTQKTSTNGLTMTSPFDSIVGLHCLLIDTSNDTGDAAFWVAGCVYSVVLNPDTETVNGQTVLKVVGSFGLALAGSSSGPSAATIADAVWDEARSGHVAGGSFGEGVASVTGAVGSASGNVGGNVTGSVGSVTGLTASDVGAIKTKTDYLPAATAGAAGGVFIAGTNAATTVTTSFTTTFTGNLTGNVGGNVTGSVGSVTGLTASDVGSIKTKTDFLPSATAGAAGGVFIAGTNAATTITTALTTTFTGNLTGSVGSVTGLTASNLDATISSRMATYTQPTGFLAATFPATVASTTNITAGTITTATNVTNVSAGGIVAASFAANAITAAKLDPDVTTELQAGLATATAVSTLQTSVDNLPTNAELATALGTADDAVLTQVGLIKAKTDSLTFTVANVADVNIQYVNDVLVNGTGAEGDEWGP